MNHEFIEIKFKIFDYFYDITIFLICLIIRTYMYNECILFLICIYFLHNTIDKTKKNNQSKIFKIIY